VREVVRGGSSVVNGPVASRGVATSAACSCSSSACRRMRRARQAVLRRSSARGWSVGLSTRWRVGPAADLVARLVGSVFLRRLVTVPVKGAVADSRALLVGGEEGSLVDAGPQGLAFGAQAFDGVPGLRRGGLPRRSSPGRATALNVAGSGPSACSHPRARPRGP
jgi:hypothetical protein